MSRVIRRSTTPNLAVVRPIINHYITNTPLVGDDFEQDTQHVLILLLTFLTGYPEAETIVRIATQADGRVGFNELSLKCEGVGAMALDLIETEKVIKELFYSGEKKPNMYWGNSKRT